MQVSGPVANEGNQGHHSDEDITCPTLDLFNKFTTCLDKAAFCGTTMLPKEQNNRSNYQFNEI